VNLLEYESTRNAFINVSLVNRDSNVIADETFLKFSPSFQNHITQQDAIKFWNLDEVLGTVSNDRVLAINALELPKENTRIPLHISQYRATNYTLRFTVNGLNEQQIWLHDKEQERFTRISPEEETEFEFSQKASDKERFEIVIQPQFSTFMLGNEPLNNKGILAYPNPVTGDKVQIALNYPTEMKPVNYTWIDFSGKEIHAGIVAPNHNENASSISIPEYLKNGVYMLKLEIGGLKQQVPVVVLR
jgi:hypothetical protein